MLINLPWLTYLSVPWNITVTREDFVWLGRGSSEMLDHRFSENFDLRQKLSYFSPCSYSTIFSTHKSTQT
jgi:hypothetical protein